MKKNCRCLFFILLLPLLVYAQPIKLYSPADLHQELDYLQQQLEQKQPNWQVYHPKEDWEQRLATVKAQIKRPLTALQWYQKLNYVLESVHEGHIIVGKANDAFYTGFVTGDFKVLPLIVRSVGERVYIWTNLSDHEYLERGDELLRINGRSIDVIRRQIFDHTLADGHIKSSKQLFFQEEFAARYFWFVEMPDSFVLEYRPFGKTTTQTTTIAALTHLEMAQWMIQRNLPPPSRPRGLDALYSCNFYEQTALVTLRDFSSKSWEVYDKTPATFYKQLFKRLRNNKTKHLIIDLRGNKGGNKNFVDAILPYFWLEQRQGIYRSLLRSNGYLVESILPNRNALYFKGQIYILTDGKTYSTAALLAQYAVHYAKAISIGTETGSRLEGFAAGGHSTTTLPYSKIEIKIPNGWVQHKLRSTPSLANRGLLPYYKVEPTINDLIKERDVVLEKAWNLINAKQGEN